MAFSIRRTSGVGPAGSRIPSALGGHGAMDELNITPMVDVLLALLIIFMVVTPVLSEYAAEPPTATYVTPHTLEDAITLGIDQRGTFFLGPDTVPAAELPARLQAIFRARPGDHLLYLRADRSLSYSVVLNAIDAARTAGVRTIGAISLPSGDTAARRRR
ncbi:MAG TPA: biopolymer transporter ExbD [Gemmatimonadales bacterium]|nr:biopolymer transporter ExbD [Gemmatimonadales bacterium]